MKVDIEILNMLVYITYSYLNMLINSSVIHFLINNKKNVHGSDIICVVNYLV